MSSATWSRRRFLRHGAGSALAVALGLPRPAASEDILYGPAEECVQRGLAYLAAAQDKSGAFGEGASHGNLAVTALCGLAVLAGGHHPGRSSFGAVVHKALRFILEHQQSNGFLHNRRASLGGAMYSHGFASLLLAEAQGAVRDRELAAGMRGGLKRAVTLLVETQNREGGWRYEPQPEERADLSVTVCQVMALRAAADAGFAVPTQTMTRSAGFLESCQVLPEGGFRYTPPPEAGPVSLPLTAAGLVGLHCCGVYGGKRIEAGRRYLEGLRPSKSPRVHPDYFLYGHYYAALAMQQGPRSDWIAWYKEVRDLLCEKLPNAAELYPNRRRAEGNWTDHKYGHHYATALACLILQMPRQQLPSFRL